jgi:hypothetical protein
VTELFWRNGKWKFGLDRCVTGIMVAQGRLVAIVPAGLRRIGVGYGTGGLVRSNGDEEQNFGMIVAFKHGL